MISNVATGERPVDTIVGHDGVEPFRVSLSAEQTFLECEQEYYYRYIEGLRRRERSLAPERGSIFHGCYLEPFYKAFVAKPDADGNVYRGLSRWDVPSDSEVAEAHERALEYVEANRRSCMEYASICATVGNDKMANEFVELTDVVLRIAERYFKVRGRADAERFEPLMVEESIDVMLPGGSTRVGSMVIQNEGIRSNGKIDILAWDREQVRLCIWEHKTTENVPPEVIRLRDLQTLLYAAKVISQQGSGNIWDQVLSDFAAEDGSVIPVTEVIWNYLRMKEPTVPEILKGREKKDGTVVGGGVTKRANLDSTWDVYAETVRSVGDDPDAPIYDSVRENLAGREEKVFFPRFEKTIVLNQNKMLTSYVATAQRMRRTVAMWRQALAAGKTPNIERSITRNCDRCEFSKLCMADLCGGEIGGIIQMNFTTRGGR